MAADTPATFFSYSREDSDFALRLAEDLKAAGAAVWIDQIDIDAGQEWDNAIEDAVARCPRMLLILSPAAVKSKKVRNELAFALDEQKNIIPVLYQDCAVPLQLRRIQRIDFRTDYDRALKTLLKNLGVPQRPAAIWVEGSNPFSGAQETENQKLLRIEEVLHKRVVAQDHAINAVARAIRRSRAGFKSPNRPIGSFLFLGPTGVGKTEVARTLAEFLFGSEKALVHFEMGEFMEKYTVSKLLGSPPGYVGHEKGGQLTERIKQAPHAVVLLDEIEKAHPDVFNILQQVFEDGQLNDASGAAVDFRNTIVIMTSGIGARHVQKPASLGFDESPQSNSSKAAELVKKEMERAFNPRFLNAIDEILIFNALTDQDLIEVLELMVGQLNSHLLKRSLTVTLTEEARRWILGKTADDRRYGARPLRRALQKYIEDPLSEAVIQGAVGQGTTFLAVYLENDELYYRPVGEEKIEGVRLDSR